jgi:hypothetical protein
MTTRIKLRRDTATNWENANPVLALGEAGYDTTNNQLRVGDGTTSWTGLQPIGGVGGGNITSPDGDNIMWLTDNGELRAGPNGLYDINIGRTTNNTARAHITVSQDGPYIRSEVISTTNQNYQNDMLWHDTWFSRYSKVTADAYGVHIKNAQWSGPANEYNNKWTFTKDGILDLPPRAEIRANPFPQGSGGSEGGGASYDVPNDNFDQSLTLTANTVMITGGRLDVAGSAKDGWITTLGPYPNNSNDYWYEAVAVDTDGNVYAAGGTYNSNHNSIVTKFLANGSVAWNKYIDYDGTPWSGEPNSITFNYTNSTVELTTNQFNGQGSVAHFTLNPVTGAVSSNHTITNNEPQNIQVYDVAMPTWGSGDLIYVGTRNSSTAYFTPNVSGITQSLTQRLVVHADTFSGDLTPDLSQGTWYMFGTGITSNVAINNVNNVASATASRVSGSGTGTDATFDVSYTRGGAYGIQVNGAGTNYANDDVLKILGSALGGTSPANDVTFHITTDAGAITGVSSVTGTATLNYTLGLTGNPVDFTTLATPTIQVATSTDGWLTWSGSTYIMGNVGYDRINTVTCEYASADGNIYIGGQVQIGSGGHYKAFVAKVNMDGGDVQWARCVDDYTAVGGTQQGGTVTGVVSDSDHAVISLATNRLSVLTITKVDTNGSLVWQRILGTAGSVDGALGIALGDDNSVLVTALLQAYQEQNNYDLMITKIDKDGNQVWSRSFGTMQSDGSPWENNYRDITVAGDYFLVNGWTNGLANQRTNNSNGYVSKFPLDGTGVGRYDDFYYQSIDGAADFQTVGNTAANVIALPWRNVTSTGEAFNFSTLSDISALNETTDTLRVKTGGPGVIQGVNQIRFANGSTISNTEEEGLIIWQPNNDGNNAEYVGLAYGGTATDSDFQPNIMISAGTDTYGHDDGDLDNYNFPSTDVRQVNIDIIGTYNGSEDQHNISNWHFDEDGSLYLPAQGYYYYDGCNTTANVDLGNGLATYYFNRSTYPGLYESLSEGDRAFDPINTVNWTPIYERGTIDSANCFVTLANSFVSSIPQIGFTNARRNGIVYADGSQQYEGGRKYVPGFGGELGQKKTFASFNGSSEHLLWISDKNNISAFRGTFRFQMGDTSYGVKMYDISGATYQGGGGDTDFLATPLVNIATGSGHENPYTFSLVLGADGHLRLYATNPSGYTGYSYVTWDITEFGYTAD